MEFDDHGLVIWGMSCVGKTTFAQTLSRRYCCFDALFPWNDIETLGLSTEAGLEQVTKFALESDDSFVIDGWHLSDPQGEKMPEDAAVCCVYATYDQIIKQYRVPVDRHDQHRPMFRKWYHEIDYPAFQTINFIQNTGHSFIETSLEDFLIFLDLELSQDV